MDAFERLSILRDYTGLSLNGLAKKIGTLPQNLYDIRNGKHGFSNALASQICDAYPNINKMWLLTGEGRMTKENEVMQPKSAIVDGLQDTVRFIPLLPFAAAAGYMAGGNDIDAFRQDSIVFADFSARGADCAIRVDGNSMYPRYSNGDILAIRIIKEPSFFQWGKVYVLSTNQGCVVKRLFPDPQHTDRLICHSENSTDYPDYTIEKADVLAVAIVVGHAGVE